MEIMRKVETEDPGKHHPFKMKLHEVRSHTYREFSIESPLSVTMLGAL